MENYIIETKRLFFRKITTEDVQNFYKLDSNPNVHKYLGGNTVTTFIDSEKYIESILNQYKEIGFGRYALIEKSSNNFIGWAGIKKESNLIPNLTYFDIGYRLLEQFWGLGYGFEAAKASLDYGFNTLNLSKICAAADVNNVASNKILVKIGMQKKEVFTHKNMLCNWYELNKNL